MRDLFRLLAALSSLCSPKNPRHDRAANVAASHAAADVEATGEATGEAAMAAAARLAVAEAAAAADAAAEAKAKAKAKAKAGFMTGAVFLLVLCVAPALNAQFSAGKLWLPTMGSAENVKLTLSPEFLVSVFGGAFPAKEEEQSPAPSFSVVHDAPDPQILVSMLDDTQRLLEDTQRLLEDAQRLLEDAQHLLLEANRKLAQVVPHPTCGVVPPCLRARQALLRAGGTQARRRSSRPGSDDSDGMPLRGVPLTPPHPACRAGQCRAVHWTAWDWTGRD